MLKKVFPLLIVIICFSCNQTKNAATTTKQINLAQKRILFLGNSITHDGFYVSLIEYALSKAHPSNPHDLISLGLNSETVSGLSEPAHPFPRPHLFDRLDSILVKVQPDLVIASYGINDGIYYPFSPKRFAAYRKGIKTLIDKVKAHSAKLILLTPSPFDGLSITKQLADLDTKEFSWKNPYKGYDEVLSKYSEWLNSLDETVVDWHTAINQDLLEKRQTDSTFAHTKDGIHPTKEGHFLMAQLFFQGLHLNKYRQFLIDYDTVRQDTFFQKVHQRRVHRSNEWRKMTSQ